MNENEFEIDGNLYVSKQVRFGNGCKSCALMTIGHRCAAKLFPEGMIPSCDSGFRDDGVNVIFVEKQP